jgi:hypothetical protein
VEAPATAAVEASATVETTADRTASEAAPSDERWPTTDEAGTATFECWSPEAWPEESRAPNKARTSIEAVKPWARPDEHAAGEVVRSVVAVGRAGVRVIAIVAVSTGRSWT